MGGERLWEILSKPIKNVRILVLFPSFNAYETVNEFETSYEKPVPSQPSLHVRDETMKRCFITEYNIFQLDPLLPSLISYLHTSTIFYKYVKIFIILASLDAYKTIKAIEIPCIKAFAYSEYMKRMLYC